MSKFPLFDGRLRLINNNHTVVLTFWCNDLYQLTLETKISAIASPNESATEIQVKPSKAKTVLYSDGRYGICLAVTKYLPKGLVTPENRYRKVKVAVDPKDFGLASDSFIEDVDGRMLFRELEKLDFELHPIRTTCNNQMGDLLVLRKGKLYSLHITRFNPTVNRLDNRLRLRHYIIGKIAFQTFNAKTKQAPKCIVIMHSDLLGKKVITQKVLDFFGSLNLQVIFSDFKPDWQKAVSEKLKNLTAPTRSPK